MVSKTAQKYDNLQAKLTRPIVFHKLAISISIRPRPILLAAVHIKKLNKLGDMGKYLLGLLEIERMIGHEWEYRRVTM